MQLNLQSFITKYKPTRPGTIRGIKHKEMKKVIINKDLNGVVIKEDSTHALVLFESGSKMVYKKNGLKVKDI